MEHFSEEDWKLATLRAEMHCLCHAFRIDLNDPERISFPPNYLTHYYIAYNRPLRRTMFVRDFALEDRDHAGLIALISDTCEIKDGLVMPKLPQETDLEDFIRILMNFSRIRSSAEAEPSSAEPGLSSAEPEPSSADVKYIGIS